MTAAATPTKLRNGDWGARVTGAVSSGDTITITTKSGKSWTATVDRVFWTNGDVTIVSTRKSAHRTSRPTSRRNWTPRDHEDCLTFGPCGPSCEYAR